MGNEDGFFYFESNLNYADDYVILAIKSQSHYETLFLPKDVETRWYSCEFIQSCKYVIYMEKMHFFWHAYRFEFETLMPLIHNKSMSIKKIIFQASVMAYEGYYHENLNRFPYDRIRKEIISSVESFYDNNNETCLIEPSKILDGIKEKLDLEPSDFSLEHLLKCGVISNYMRDDKIKYGPACVTDHPQDQVVNRAYMAKLWNEDFVQEFVDLKKDLISKIMNRLNIKIEDIEPFQKDNEITLLSISEFIETKPRDLTMAGFSHIFKFELKSKVFTEVITADNYYLLFSKVQAILLKLNSCS